MPNPVVHFEILGKDGQKLQTFYSQLFGWHIDANNPMSYGLVDTHTEGRGIGGGIGAAGEQGHPGTTIYVEVPALQPYLDKVVSLGGKVLVPETVIPNMVTFALFADPEGNVVGVTKEEPPHT